MHSLDLHKSKLILANIIQYYQVTWLQQVLLNLKEKKLIIDQHDQVAEFMTIYVLRSLWIDSQKPRNPKM